MNLECVMIEFEQNNYTYITNDNIQSAWMNSIKKSAWINALKASI